MSVKSSQEVHLKEIEYLLHIITAKELHFIFRSNLLLLLLSLLLQLLFFI